jgi:hypothetical protein
MFGAFRLTNPLSGGLLWYASLLAIAIARCRSPANLPTPPAPALHHKWAVTDISTGKSRGAYPDTKNTVNASAFVTSTQSSRPSIMR